MIILQVTGKNFLKGFAVIMKRIFSHTPSRCSQTLSKDLNSKLLDSKIHKILSNANGLPVNDMKSGKLSLKSPR